MPELADLIAYVMMGVGAVFLLAALVILFPYLLVERRDDLAEIRAAESAVRSRAERTSLH